MAVAAYRDGFGLLMVGLAVLCLGVGVLGAWLVSRAGRSAPAAAAPAPEVPV